MVFCLDTVGSVNCIFRDPLASQTDPQIIHCGVFECMCMCLLYDIHESVWLCLKKEMPKEEVVC